MMARSFFQAGLFGVASLALVTQASAGVPRPMTLAELRADEAKILAGQPASMQLVKDSISTLDNEAVERIVPRAASNPDNVKRAERIVSEADWDELFPMRAPEYTYTNFLRGIGKFPAFCGAYGDGRDANAICKKSLATMFAHFVQETGGHDASVATPEWRQGLVYLREVGWTEGAANGYGICSPDSWQGQAWPCAEHPGGGYLSYFGRGAKQLSYNYNYGPFSQAIYGDVNTLLERPYLVADTWLNLASAVFFYVYPQPPKPSMLHVIDGTWQPNEVDTAGGLEPGFGVTTQIINGGVECGGSVEHEQSENRIEYYRSFAEYLGVAVPSDEVLGCAEMDQFDSGGAGSLPVFWEKDWSWVQGNPDDGASFRCALVNYQTKYSAFLSGDYEKCVQAHFDVAVTGGNAVGRTAEGSRPQATGSSTRGVDGRAGTGSSGVAVGGTQRVAGTTGASASPWSWWPGVEYSAGFKVRHNGGVWVSRFSTQGGEPGVAAAWKFISGTRKVKEWDSSVAYEGGASATYKGKQYTAAWWTQGERPGVAKSGPWKLSG